MDLPDWISFRKYPAKLFRYLLVTAVVVALFWGFINRDREKGINLFIEEIRFIVQPLSHNLEGRIKKFSELFNVITDNSFQHIQKE